MRSGYANPELYRFCGKDYETADCPSPFREGTQNLPASWQKPANTPNPAFPHAGGERSIALTALLIMLLI
jgi:hypothetical protein